MVLFKSGAASTPDRAARSSKTRSGARRDFARGVVELRSSRGAAGRASSRPGHRPGFSETSPKLDSEKRLTAWARHASERRRRAATERRPRRWIRRWGSEREETGEGRNSGRTAEGATIPRVIVASAVEGVRALKSAEACLGVKAVRPHPKGASSPRTPQ